MILQKLIQKIKSRKNTFKKRKVVISTAHKLYDELSSIYKTQYFKLKRDKKKRIKAQNMLENLPRR